MRRSLNDPNDEDQPESKIEAKARNGDPTKPGRKTSRRIRNQTSDDWRGKAKTKSIENREANGSTIGDTHWLYKVGAPT